MILPQLAKRWKFLTLLGLALLCAQPVQGQEPLLEVPPPVEMPPLFGLPIVRDNHLAVLVVGMGADSNLGAYRAITGLVTGEHPQARAWEIFPLTLERSFQVQSGAATAFLAGANAQSMGPLSGGMSLLATLGWGDSRDIWTLRDTTKIEVIPPLLLDYIKDNSGIPPAQSGDLELDAYFAFLIAAHRTPEAVMQKYAREDVSYAHLFTQPATYRGEVVKLEGKLRRIRKFEAPATMKDKGIPYLYEGWIFYKTLGANPFCILFTELPKGFRVAEEMEIDVKFAGYFYKKYRYTPADQPAGRKNYKREAPLLIGHAIMAAEGGQVIYPDERPDTNWARTFLPLFVGAIFSVVMAVFLLMIWTRRADRVIHKRLSALQPKELTLPVAEEGDRSEAGSDTVSSIQSGDSPRT